MNSKLAYEMSNLTQSILKKSEADQEALIQVNQMLSLIEYMKNHIDVHDLKLESVNKISGVTNFNNFKAFLFL